MLKTWCDGGVKSVRTPISRSKGSLLSSLCCRFGARILGPCQSERLDTVNLASPLREQYPLRPIMRHQVSVDSS